VSRPSLTRRLLLTVFTVIVVFFGITVLLLDIVFRHAAERSLRELLDAQMVALIAAADPFRHTRLGPVRGNPFRERRNHLAIAVDHRHGSAVRSAPRSR
jgi:hypothetical protein